MKKPVILTFVAHYLPAYKSGGPVRTIANFVNHLGDVFDIKVITSDRDATDKRPYVNIRHREWNRVGKAWVRYLSPAEQSFRACSKLYCNMDYDVLYLNSYYNLRFTLWPLLARRLAGHCDKPVVIAPRGEFAVGAMNLKRYKKLPYRFVTHLFGLYRSLIWQASSPYEAKDIFRFLGCSEATVRIAPNLPSLPPDDSFHVRERAKGQPLRLVFISRIAPVKNLNVALGMLNDVKVPVVFDVYGPIRDSGYWEKCIAIIEQLPPHIRVKYHGAVPPARVPDIIANHDLFFLPTMGENYGHAIAESLSVGTPVLITNTTPWRQLQDAGVGWDLPVGERCRFVKAIHYAAAVDPLNYGDWRKKIRSYASKAMNLEATIQVNQQLFTAAINHRNTL